MIDIDNKIVSLDVFDTCFACDLSACKGACCIEGDSGAPLSEEEVIELQKAYPVVKQFLSEKSIRAIEEQGITVIDQENEQVTPLVGGKECAYVYFEDGIALCAIEKAWKLKLISFQKPVSCHLYPIRIKSYANFDAVNYDRWNICRPAVLKGHEKKIKLINFVETALVRKYGRNWVDLLEKAREIYENGYK